MIDWLKTLLRKYFIIPFARALVIAEPYAQSITNEKILRQFAKTGGNVTLRNNVTIKNPNNLKVGKNILFNDNCRINAKGGIVIGDDVVIGPGCLMLTNNHRGNRFFGNTTSAPIEIGNNVWLAANVVITPGITIGNNVIVAAGAVVTKNIPGDCIVGGVPASILKELELPFEPQGTMKGLNI